MNKLVIIGITLVLLAAYGCSVSSKTITFEQGVERLNEMDKEYGSNMKTPPNSTEKIDGLLTQITGFAALNKNMPQALEYLLDFRIKSLEAEKLHIEGWQWGRASTTEWGFGCKNGYARITESAQLRNNSAQKGYEAVSILQLIIDEFPEEAKSLNLTQKDILFLNAAYTQVEEKARRDAAIVQKLCIDNVKETNETG